MFPQKACYLSEYRAAAESRHTSPLALSARDGQCSSSRAGIAPDQRDDPVTGAVATWSGPEERVRLRPERSAGIDTGLNDNANQLRDDIRAFALHEQRSLRDNSASVLNSAGSSRGVSTPRTSPAEYASNGRFGPPTSRP